MDILEKIDELIEKPRYLMDFLPAFSMPVDDDRCFAIEEYFQSHRAEINRKFTNILLKLYCRYDFVVSSGEQVYENPSVPHLLSLIAHCFDGPWESRDYINIVLPQCDAMITLNGDDLFLILHDPDDALKSFASELARSEGLFFYATSDS